MPTHVRVLFLIASFLVIDARLRAQTPPSSVPPTIQETVVVTATGRETKESQVGATITVLGSEVIEQRHALSTIDLLRMVPGVVAVRSGGVGNLTGVYVRGGESTYNKVLVDGMPMNEPGGAFNFASLSPENVERIEVLRGAHSALFGSDAMASVIQVFLTRPQTERPQVSLMAAGGNFGTGHASAGVGARRQSFEYSLFASHLATNNEAPNNEHEATTFSGGLTRSWTSGGSLRVVGRGEFGRAGVPGATAFGRADTDAFFRHNDGGIMGGWNQPIGGRFVQRTSYSLVATRYRSTNLVADPPYTPRFGSLVAARQAFDFTYDSETRLARHQAEYRADTAIGSGQMLTAAFAYDGERAVLTDHLSGETPQRPARNNTGTTVQYELARDRVSVVSGIRFENNGSFGFYAAPRLAVSWLLHENASAGTTRLRGSVGRGIKEPLLIQSYSPNPSFLGNPDLEPERSRGFDLSVEQRVARNRVSFEVTYFANHFDDLISLGPFDPVTFDAQYENIGETRASGIELVGTAIANGGVRLAGSYTFLDSKVIRSISSSPIFAPGRALYRRPRHSGSLQASYTRNRMVLTLGGVFVGSRVDTDFNFPSVSSNEGFAVWNATAEVRVAPRSGVFATFENLLDRDYMEPLGYPGLGRSFRVGVRTRF